MNKKISDNQLGRLMKLGSTVTLKGFLKDGKKINGKVAFDGNHQLIFQQDSGASASKKSTTKKKAGDEMACPKCKKGTVVKGKTAYGCSNWKSGCGFKVPFTKIREALGTRPVTKAAVVAVLTKLTYKI